MAGLSGYTQFLLKMVVNPLVWLLILVGFIGGVLLVLKIRKKRRLWYSGVEIVDLGSGKTGLNFVKCGWYGINSYLKGLWWTGREVLKTSDGEIIEQFSEEDFQEVNGKRGVVFYRDPINRILVPISRLGIKNKELIAEIADASYRDVAIDIVKDAERETSDWKDRIIQFTAWALVIVFSLVAIIVIIQMVKNGQDKAAALIVEAGKTCLENAKTICSQIIQTDGGASTAP